MVSDVSNLLRITDRYLTMEEACQRWPEAMVLWDSQVVPWIGDLSFGITEESSSQLIYPQKHPNNFGLCVYRDIAQIEPYITGHNARFVHPNWSWMEWIETEECWKSKDDWTNDRHGYPYLSYSP